MRRLPLTAAGALVLVFGFCIPGLGQAPTFSSGPNTGNGGPSLKRSSRPVVSPYAGLLGGGVGANSSVGYQYFTRVQPQINASRALGTLGRSVNRLTAQSQPGQTSSAYPGASTQPLSVGAPSSLGPTGHPTGYMIHTAYFGTNLRSGTMNAAPGVSTGPVPLPNPSIPVRR